MYCRNCGQKLADGDKFCSSCGAKTILADDNKKTDGISGGAGTAEPQTQADPAAEAKEPLFEPFDFKSFGFLDSDPASENAASGTEEKKATLPSEEFDWNIHTFPGMEVEKTEDVDFNWSMTPEEVDAEEAQHAKTAARPEVFSAEPRSWNSTEPQAAETPANPESKADAGTSSLEKELFGGLDSKTDETKKQSEEIDKFFTFHQKNEEFQKLLDQEYEKIKSGNILTEEMNAAETVSEEKFAARKPEDPMEELFASEGIVKGYEPKPVESDVLERIEAAEAEKKAREDAAKLIEEEKRKAKEEAERKVKEEAEELAKAQAAEEAARRRLDEEAKRLADARAAQEAAERELERAVARGQQVEETAEPPKTEEAEPQPQTAAAQEPAAETPKAETPKEEALNAQAAEQPAAVPETIPQSDAMTESQDEQEDAPVKTKPVDKAAILAGMATASEMVQRDRAYAAAEAAAKAAEQAEPEPIELPDFLGHLEETEPQEAPAQAQQTPEPQAVEIEPDKPRELSQTDSVDTIEQLEDLSAAASQSAEPVEELEEIPAELFSIEDLLDDEQQMPADKEVIDAEPVAEETAIGQNPAEQQFSGQNGETAEEAAAFPANYNPAEDISEAIEEEKAEAQDNAEIHFAQLEEEDEEEDKGGKGRIVLKVCLVVLIILLIMEIAGVVIKIAAPNSGAAKFIDSQLNNVIHLFSGDEDTEYSVFADTEDVRTEPVENKTQLIKAEMGKNKDENIKKIEYNKELTFDANTKYENPDIQLTQELADVTWYKDAENKQVYYDQAIVGAVIAYDSQRVNLMNHKDTSVLSLMKKGTDLYKDVKEQKGNADMTFEQLQIGEIRQAGNSYFVWVSEKTRSARDGGEDVEKIYEIEPDGKTMKVVNSYEI